jgi:NTP pyrophosphatase (non-canonical NTP hydrolase)
MMTHDERAEHIKNVLEAFLHAHAILREKELSSATCGGEPCRLRTLIGAVEFWALDRGILQHSTPQAQLLKTMSELGELADATIKGRPADVVDGIGDVLVTLIIYAKLQGVTLIECLSAAYDQIKDRRGRMVPGGAFVKEGDE